jgi:hypothetical protein
METQAPAAETPVKEARGAGLARWRANRAAQGLPMWSGNKGPRGPHKEKKGLSDSASLELATKQAFMLNRLYGLDATTWLQEAVKTRDEHDKAHPVKPFPFKPYVAPLFERFDKEKTTFIIKSRQMVITWLACAYALHASQFFEHQLALIISEKFEKSAALVERIRFMYTHQPAWLQTLNPLDRKMCDQPIGTLTFNKGSRILALPEGPDQVRMHTASLIVMDEADFYESFQKTYDACLPSIHGGGKLIALSTVNPGMFSKMCGLIE